MEKLQHLIIHCTATPEGREVTREEIRLWHTSPPPNGRGWKQVGYSDLIHLDGMISNIVPYNGDGIVQPREMTNGAIGTNGKARHVVYAGGCDKKLNPKDTRTEKQIESLTNYVKRFLQANPNATVGGHNQFAVKACPSFDVQKWLRSIGVNEKNICKESLKYIIK